MKTKYLAVLIAAMGSSLSFGASIDGLDAAYSKDSTVYGGTSGDALTVSSPTTIGVNNTAHWTMAFHDFRSGKHFRVKCRIAVYL